MAATKGSYTIHQVTFSCTGARLLVATGGTFGEEKERWPKSVVFLVYGFG